MGWGGLSGRVMGLWTVSASGAEALSRGTVYRSAKALRHPKATPRSTSRSTSRSKATDRSVRSTRSFSAVSFGRFLPGRAFPVGESEAGRSVWMIYETRRLRSRPRTRRPASLMSVRIEKCRALLLLSLTQPHRLPRIQAARAVCVLRLSFCI